MTVPSEVIEAIQNSDEIVADFKALTACGGRLVGSASETEAHTLLAAKFADVPGVSTGAHEFELRRWTNSVCALENIAPTPTRSLPCHPLVWSGDTPLGGIEADVVDLGRGTAEDFAAAGDRVPGRFALVRHEYPFARTTIHRRIKYRLASEYGALGFIIANPLPEAGLVTGSCGVDTARNIPGIGIGHGTAETLARGGRVRLRVQNQRDTATRTNLIAEIPGRGTGWVVVSAHYDGHDLADSALDNATGVVAALEILRRFAAYVPAMPRGLRVMLFTAEEAALLGSRIYVDTLDAKSRQAITAVINLDTLVGSPKFTCLTSGFAALDDFVASVGTETGHNIATWRPIMRNSDHFNFARHGIPALRLIAGFDDPDADARYLLTSADTTDLVTDDGLREGAMVAAELAWAALTSKRPIAEHLSARETERFLQSLG